MKECYTLVQMVNGKTNITMKNHIFVREKEDSEFSACSKCGVVVNRELIECANKQTGGKFLTIS